MPKSSHTTSGAMPQKQLPNQEIGVSVPDSETVTEDKKKHFTVSRVFSISVNRIFSLEFGPEEIDLAVGIGLV